MKPTQKTQSLLFPVFILLLLLIPFGAKASGGGSGDEHSMTHRMMMLVLQFGVIIFAAKLMGLLFSMLKIPDVLGELFAGIIFGAYALGGVSLPGFPDGLFPMFGSSSVSPELYGIATIASIVLLFDVGLETDLKMLIRYFFAGSLVGLGGVAASFMLGAFVGYYFSPMLGYHPSSLFDPLCMFMGIASTATSVGITARVLSSKGKLDSPEGVTILSAAVIDDVVGIILLAVVTGIAAAQQASGGKTDWGHIGMIAFKAIAVWLIATVAGIAASRHISFLLKLFKERTAIGVMAFGMALILAGLFEEAGLAMIIGAYVMGLSISKSDIVHVVREKLHPVYALTVPVFFCVTGMLINVQAMADKQVLAFAGIYTVTALAAKVFGCGLPALMANFNLRGALRVGVGMTPRGEVGLIIAALGLGAGFLTDQLFAAIIVMVVVNTVVAPPALVALFKNPALGVRKNVNTDSSEKQLRFNFGSFATGNLFITKLNSLLNAEGFYTHQVSRRDRIYQARKNEIVIDYQQNGTEITFTYFERDHQIVHTAILDAGASVEKEIGGLHNPLEGIINMHKAISEETGIADSTMTSAPKRKRLMQVLKLHCVKTGLHEMEKTKIVEELLSFLCDTGQLPRRCFDSVLKAVLERENSMSTGFSGGLAIPHARVKCIDGLACVVGVFPDGVNFDALDGQPTYMVALTLSPTSKPTPHLEFIAEITAGYQRVGADRIRSARDSEEVFTLLTL
ncbi:MAG: cation:proton antiporter [Deltaproteobacteria bacterium]|nr:cation:proton antiporter [Deltaproteobacteria bacterium]MBN2672623.1 cation:proton antiporter [Deltaproteobacteria bacterium]